MGFETESLPYGHNQSFDVSPPRVRRAKDKISLPEGTLQLIAIVELHAMHFKKVLPN